MTATERLNSDESTSKDDDVFVRERAEERE